MSITTEERRLLVASAAPSLGSLGAFALAAVTRSAADPIVLCALGLAVAAAGVAGGRLGAAPVAVTAALAFDFFHVEPVLVLHGTTLLGLLAGLGAVAVLAGASSHYN